MSNVERRRGARPRGASSGAPWSALSDGLRPRVAAAVGTVCLLLSAGPVLGVLGGPQAGGITPAAPLDVAIASHDGDVVTSTPSESALAGSDVTDQVTVSNTTPDAQSNVSVPITLPASFTLHDATVTTSTGTALVSTGGLSWTIPTLAAGATATISYTETTDAPAALESDTTSASATSDQVTTPSPVSGSVEVIPASDLTISVSDGTGTIAPGAADTYTITLTNNGPSPATNATVSDTFDAAFAATSSVASIGGTTFTDLGGGQFEWTGINLAGGASAYIDPHGQRAVIACRGERFREPGDGLIGTRPGRHGRLLERRRLGPRVRHHPGRPARRRHRFPRRGRGDLDSQ